MCLIWRSTHIYIQAYLYVFIYIFTCAYASICHHRHDNVPHLSLDTLNIQAHFNSWLDSSANKGVVVSDMGEESFYAVGEWSKYIAAFFNQEERVKGLADTAQMRCLNTIELCV